MDRFSICMAYWIFYCLWHSGGLTARCHAKGRGIGAQLHRMRFSPGMGGGDYADLREDSTAREVYIGLVAKYHGRERANEEDALIDAGEEA